MAEPITSPLPITDRLRICVTMLRLARDEGDPTREWAWESMLDRLLDRYAQGYR